LDQSSSPPRYKNFYQKREKVAIFSFFDFFFLILRFEQKNWYFQIAHKILHNIAGACMGLLAIFDIWFRKNSKKALNFDEQYRDK